MKRTKRFGAACAAVLLALAQTAAAVSALEDDDIVLPAEEQEEVATYTSGDYVFSRLVGVEDQTKVAAQIEQYTGKETNLVIPSVLDGLDVISLGDYAFVGNGAITTVTIPASVIGIGTYTFANSVRIERYEVEAGNPVFESVDGVLYGDEKTNLVRYPVGSYPKDVVIPDDVLTISPSAFACAASMTSVTFPAGLQSIGEAAFVDCTALTAVTVPKDVIGIASFTFNNCKNLKDVTLHDGIQGIGNAAFAGTAVSSFTIPAACTTIGQQAFADTKLTEITIPPTVTSIGFSAFGWNLNIYDELTMDKNFTIYGVKGSAAEAYASDEDNENDFNFISTSADASDNSSSAADTTATIAPPADDQQIGIGRIIGIGLCAALLVVIAVVAALTGKKKEKEAHPDES